MLLRVFRILAAYVLACAGFALVLVAFVFTPAELVSGGAGPDTGSSPWAMAGLQLFASTIQVMIFAALPVLVVAVIAEWRAIGGWIYYAAMALLLAGVGFLARYASELQGAPTIVNNYAFIAFMCGGFVAGIVYWLVAGRRAGVRAMPAGGADV